MFLFYKAGKIFFFLIVSILITVNYSNSQSLIDDSTVFLKNNKAIFDELQKVQSTLIEATKKNPNNEILTFLVAFTAVIVSVISAFLNYKVFKGQSISSYRKTWNNNLIEFTSDLIVKATDLFASVNKGVLPATFDSDIVNLNKIAYSISFKVKEIGVENSVELEQNISGIIYKIINSKKSPSANDLAEFNTLIKSLSVIVNDILASNWESIKKFN